MKLFMFYVGGNCGNSNVELHDVRFSLGATAEDCHEDLKQQWWGDPKGFHLDCWGEVAQVDGFDVVLTTAPPREDPYKLFFVNLGGYVPTEFSELHKNVLLVASDAVAAKAKAIAQIQSWSQPHRDQLFEVEKAVDVTALMVRYGYFPEPGSGDDVRSPLSLFANICRWHETDLVVRTSAKRS